jgi:hypothetical protein
MAMEYSSKNGNIEWSISVRRTPNGHFHAVVKVGKETETSEDHLTQDLAKDDGCRMMADMLQRVEELLHA